MRVAAALPLLLAALAAVCGGRAFLGATAPAPGAAAGGRGLRGSAPDAPAAGARAAASGRPLAFGAAGALALLALAGSRQRSRAPAVQRAAVAVGQKVTWNGKGGTAAYVGSTKFAGGEWVGVALDAPEGMHDGTVLGVHYFSCAPKCGIFAPEAALGIAGAPPPPSPAAPAAPSVLGSEEDCSVSDYQMCVGCKVLWNGKPGTVCYIGKLKFAAGEWVGVELDQPQGMHDGTVMNVPYFACKPKHGIFSPPAALTVTAPA